MEKEKPLLGESGGSGGGSGSSSSRRRSVRRRDQPPKFTRRSDAITYGSRYQKAAALVDLAEDGVGIPEQVLDQENFEHTAKYYFFYIKFDFIWTLNYFAMLALNFLEKPLWCLNSEHSCNDREYFYLGELPYLMTSESLIFEGITLIILVGQIFFPISYEGFRIFWNNPLSRMKVACLAILVADILVYSLYLSPVALNVIPFRIAPYIRVVLFILDIRGLQKTIVILGGMLRTYLNVLALWLLFLLFASWLAYVIFEDTQQGKTVFTSYGITLYQMFVLFTTSNNPDVWIPAYKTSRFSCLFFVLYVLLGVYFVTNLVLAVVYDSFKSQLVKQISETDSARQRILIKVFNLIDEDVFIGVSCDTNQYRSLLGWHYLVKVAKDAITPKIILFTFRERYDMEEKYANVGFLNKEQCILLFHELNRYRTLPNISREEFELIFDELDDSHDFKINLGEFTDLCNAIALKFQKEDVESYFEYLGLYHWPSSEKLKVFVRSTIFGYIVSFILTLNLIAVIIETTLDMENNSAQQVWQVVESVFGWIYVVEMALKVYAFGFANYWRDGHNRFDFMITWIIVVGETITFVSPDGMMFFSNGEWIRYLLIARMLRLIRILMHIQSCRAFVATFLTLIPSLMPYLGTIFCVMCMYCSLGVQIFGGIVNVGNPKLDATDLADNDYLLFNFNDYPNGMMTLFNLLVMQNWQAWMQGYKDLTGTWWSLTYFISYYLITVLLLLNLVVAFVLEAFFAELDIEKSESGEGENKDVTGVKSRRRIVGAKTRSERVDLLLHHMLSAELGKTEQQSSDA